MRLRLVLLVLIVLSMLSAKAQDSLSSKSTKKWNFLADVYLLFPYMSGQGGVGQAQFTIASVPADVYSNLQAGIMLFLEARTNKWAINSDLVYSNIVQDIPPDGRINAGESSIKLLTWEASVLYRVAPHIELGAGGRVASLEAGAEGVMKTFSGTASFGGSRNRTWYDPIVIARFTQDIKGKWLFVVRGDAGGFGVGSKFTWQMQAYAGYRFTKLFQLTGGYRILSINYDNGDASKALLLDANMYGPVIRFGFNF